MNTPQLPILDGAAVTLRPITDADTDLIVKWRNTPSVVQNFIFRQTFTPEMHRSWLATKVATGQVVQYIIVDKADAGVEVEQLDLQRGDWDRNKGQEICQNDLAKYGDQIEVVFCNNDDMAIGALQAIQAAGRTVNKDIYLVGVDALDAAKNEVANGNMTGTVLNDAKGQATQAVASMEELLGGKTFEAGSQSVYVDYVKVTPDNVKDFQ